jgi:hypothetical protein
MGHGREAYVWSLLAAVGLFVVGAAVSIWHGISDLLHEPTGHESYLIAYIVLGFAIVIEGISFIQAKRQLDAVARAYDRELLEHALATSEWVASTSSAIQPNPPSRSGCANWNARWKPIRG